MRRFSFVHRAAAVLTSVLMLQLSLLGAGTLCRMHAGPEKMAAHAGHTMPAGAHHGCDGARTNKSCDTSPTPAGCAAMSSCGAPVAALAVAMEATVTPSPNPLNAAPPANALLGPEFSPEIPPPRA